MSHKPTSLFEASILVPAIGGAFRKLDPRLMVKNPVMFVTLVGAVLTTVSTFTSKVEHGFILQLSFWLWFTVLCANFAEAVAEGRGKAQADSLRNARKDAMARRLKNGVEEKVSASALEKGDLVVCEAGDGIPADGEVIEGIASVDEAAITGESAPVIRESGGDRSAVTGGTHVLSDRIVIRITSEKGNTFLDRMISMVEGAQRQKTPNEIALTILLSAMTLIFLLVTITLKGFGTYSGIAFSTPVLVALLVCLIPTTIGGLLSAIGISGIDRLIRRNVMATSGRAVEAAGDIDVLLLDKTGTITIGNRMASECAAHGWCGAKSLRREPHSLDSPCRHTPELRLACRVGGALAAFESGGKGKPHTISRPGAETRRRDCFCHRRKHFRSPAASGP